MKTEIDQGQVDGLAYSRIPSETDKTPILLLNGFATDPSPEHLNEDFISSLHNEGEREVLSVQYVHENDPPSVRAFTRNVTKVLDHLGVDKPAAVVGISYGNNPLLELAVNHPERVSHLISIIGFPGLPVVPVTREAHTVFVEGDRSPDAVSAAYGPATYRAVTSDPTKLNEKEKRHRETMQPLLTRAVNEDISDLYMEAMTSPAGVLEATQRFLGVMTLRMPGLIIGGELDRLTPAANARALYCMMPGARKLYIGESDDHGITHSRPAELATMINDFIDKMPVENIGLIEAGLRTWIKAFTIGPKIAVDCASAWTRQPLSVLRSSE